MTLRPVAGYCSSLRESSVAFHTVFDDPCLGRWPGRADLSGSPAFAFLAEQRRPRRSGVVRLEDGESGAFLADDRRAHRDRSPDTTTVGAVPAARGRGGGPGGCARTAGSTITRGAVPILVEDTARDVLWVCGIIGRSVRHPGSRSRRRRSRPPAVDIAHADQLPTDRLLDQRIGSGPRNDVTHWDESSPMGDSGV